MLNDVLTSILNEWTGKTTYCLCLFLCVVLFVNAIKNRHNMTPSEFLRMRKNHRWKHDFAGVYILHNETNGKYYVGQGKNVLSRVNNHFTGHGNGDVYADYKYRNRFSIRIIPLKRSGYKTLNDLERNMINKYDAYNHGYNKTRGNK